MDATITSKGQTTVPKPVRDHLGLKPGDKVRFFIAPDRAVHAARVADQQFARFQQEV